MKYFICKIQIVVVLLFIFLNNYSQEIKSKNVILMIGDGMGINQVYAAMQKENNPLNIERCPVVGLIKTYSLDNFTTDSGAAGTALACGVKTKNGMIGMNADSVPQPSILEIIDSAGFSTGLVVTCNVTHATPASFVAHQLSRKMTEEIALDYLASGIDVFIGGGKNDFSQRKDNKNLFSELIKEGYHVCYSVSEFSEVKGQKLAALVADDHPPKVEERDSLLYKGTAKAIELLSQNKKGFFLMIEGSQIDWAGHDNDLDEVIAELMDFDEVVGLVLDYAERDGNTLVVITADHETGGLVLLDKDPVSGEMKIMFTTEEHSGMPVPVYSFGPGSDSFTGFMENTSLFEKILRFYRLKN